MKFHIINVDTLHINRCQFLFNLDKHIYFLDYKHKIIASNFIIYDLIVAIRFCSPYPQVILIGRVFEHIRSQVGKLHIDFDNVFEFYCLELHGLLSSGNILHFLPELFVINSNAFTYTFVLFHHRLEHTAVVSACTLFLKTCDIITEAHHDACE